MGEKSFRRALTKGFPGGSDGKESDFNAGDLGLIPGSGRSPGEESGNPHEYSCLEIPWTEEPGGLQSTGLQTVEHDGAHIPYPIASTYQPPVAPPVVTTKKHLLQKLPNVPSGAKSPSHWY